MIISRYLIMKKYILIIALFLSLNLFSQNVSIKGAVRQSANSDKQSTSLVRLLTYNDMLTCEQTTIYETYTDDNGNFVIETNIDDIVMAQIAVDLERVDILLRPDSDYEIEIIIPEQNDDVSYFERQSPTLKMIKENDDDLYYQYSMSNMIIDDFVLNNFNKLYRGRQISLLDSLDVNIDKELGNISSDFVRDNLQYRKAAIQMMVNNNVKKVIENYYNKKEILYSNPAYMNLFQEIFTNYLASRQFNPSEIRNLLYADYDSFLKYVKEKDVFLSDNEDLSELIVAWNLKRMYYEMPDEKNKILNYLDYIVKHTKSAENRKLVVDILTQIKRLSFGSDAYDFSLKDKDGRTVTLSDFKDNLVLMQFVDHKSNMTDYQFEMLDNLSRQWQDTIQIVTIANREYFEEYKQMFEDKGYEWTLLNLEDDILLLEKYQIRIFPDYVILGKDNKIGMSPAPSPDQYLDFHVRRIYNYYKKNDKK